MRATSRRQPEHVERSNSGAALDARELAAHANAQTRNSDISPRELERRLVESGFATSSKGKLAPTPSGIDVGAYLG